MNVNRILIQCIFNNARRRLFEAKCEEQARAILDDMTKEIGQLEGTKDVKPETKDKLVAGLELGVKNAKSVYEILDHLEYAMIEAESPAMSQSNIRYKA